MQRKLKAVLRSTSRKKSPPAHSTDDSYDHPEVISPCVDSRSTSSSERGRALSDTSKRDSQHTGRSRPLSSIYDDRRASNTSAQQSATLDYAQTHPSDSINGAIANDYRSYLPVLSPVDDLLDEQQMTLGGDRRLIAGESDGKHEEDVADRNIDRYRSELDPGRAKPLPPIPNSVTTDQEQPRKYSIGAGSFDSTINSVPSGSPAGKYVVGRNVATKGVLIDSILPHKEVSAHDRNSWKKNDLTLYSARDEAQVGWSRRKPRRSESDDDPPRSPPDEHLVRRDQTDRRGMAAEASGERAKVHTAKMDGQQDMDGIKDWKTYQQSLLDGVLDLRDTVQTHRDTTWAPAVTHETVKPHEHEIIQQKIYREIHNYSYYHRLQPVMQTEVLPPRHFIPNPDGEGLIEISADELPTRTGKNRWWDVVQKEVPLSIEHTSHQWRTEPETIEGETYITKEGFERKETMIIYPPTLEDLSGYNGAVQPVHFDHKTGERWLGEVTTMDKLRENMGHGSKADPLSLRELSDNLPDMPPSPMIKRKPVGGSTA